MLYILVVLIGHTIYQNKGIIPESTAWYLKTYLTFSGLLEAVRKELGDIPNIVNSIVGTEFASHLLQQGKFEDFTIVVGF